MSLHVSVRVFVACLFTALFTFIHEPGATVAAALTAPLSQAAVEERVSAIAETAPDIVDDFSELSDLWGTHYDGETSTYYKAGRYHVSVNAEDLIAWGTGDMTASDFLVQADVSHYDGTLNNRGGLLFRYIDADNFYSFSVSSDGYYSLRKLEDDMWETLIDWTESEAIVVGERTTNRLTVLAEGDHITLLVNGEALSEVDDSSFVEGAIALEAGTFDEYEVDIAFDNFALWYLPLDGEPESTDPSGRLVPRDSGQSPVAGESVETIRESEPAFEEDFASGAGGWDTQSSDDAVISAEDGALRIDVRALDWVTFSGTGQQFNDFLLEVDATHVSGPTAVEYGAYFRSEDSDNYYYFGISATGQYNFWKRLDGEWTELVPWTDSASLSFGEGAQNRIGVLAEGPGIALYANDEVLTELEDESLSGGDIGVFLRTYDEADALVSFDNVAVWNLESRPIEQPVDETEPVEEMVPADMDYGKIEDRMADIRKQRPLVSEDFRVDQGEWTMDSTDDAVFKYARRKLHITVDKTNWMAWSRYETTEFGDALLEGEVEVISSPLDGSYGLIFGHADADDFYVFRISPRGTFSLMKKADGEWTTLVDWTTSDLIDTNDGAVNKLSILTEGSAISAAINEEVVAALEDADLAPGKAAIVASTYDDPGVEVAFDNITIWQLDD